MPFFLRSFSPHIHFIHTVRDWRLTTSGRARWMRWEMWMQSRFDVELKNVGICSSPLPLTLNFRVQFVESGKSWCFNSFFFHFSTFYIVRSIPDIFVWFEFPYSIFFLLSFHLFFFSLVWGVWIEPHDEPMSERDERVRQLKIVGIFFLIVRWFRIHKLQFS